MMRKELGGYYPKELDKRYFFQCLRLSLLKEQKIKSDKEKTKALARRGGN